MINVIYKKQGNGQDSWIVENSNGSKNIIYDFEVENWKLKFVLSKRNLLMDVENAINNLDGENKIKANLAWEYATVISTSSQTTKFISSVLGLNSDDLANIFIEAINTKV